MGKKPLALILSQKTGDQLNLFLYQVEVFQRSTIIIQRWSIQSPESSKIPKIYLSKNNYILLTFKFNIAINYTLSEQIAIERGKYKNE